MPSIIFTESEISIGVPPHEIIRSVDLTDADDFIIGHEQVGPANLTTYLAKDMYNPRWNDPGLETIAMLARTTYGRYGKRFGIFDRYEPKSVHFLTRVQHPVDVDGQTIETVEWHSLRFIPPDGDPPNSEDIDFYVCGPDKQPLYEVMRERLGFNGHKPQDVLITQSRLCVVRPYASDHSQQLIVETANLKNSHTNIAFAANTAALVDYMTASGKDITQMWMTSQMWEHLLYHTVAYGNQVLAFRRAGDILSTDGTPLDIRLNRQLAYVYEVPAYFLNWPQLIQTLRQIVDSGHIKIPYLDSIPDRLSLKQIDDDLQLRQNILRLTSVLTGVGVLPESDLTGEHLRDILNQTVSDQPILWLARLDLLRTSCSDIIQSAKLNI